MTKDEALKLEALKYAASNGYGLREMNTAPFIIKYDEALAAPVQEPVGVVQHKPTATFGADYEQVAVFRRALDAGTLLYTTPPAAQRQWVGLIKEDKDLIEDLCEMMIGDAAFSTIDAILKGKNT
jgi:hypothetical protein